MTDFTSFVTADWLFEHLDDPQVAIADCRFCLADSDLGWQQYQAGHIPKAYYLDLNQDLSSPVGKHGGRHPLPDPAELTNKLSAMGVNSQTVVVAYDDSHFAFAARLWWLLRYLGHERVAVLDGGFNGWRRADYPLTIDIPTPQTATFVPQLQPRVVDITTVKTCKDLPG